MGDWGTGLYQDDTAADLKNTIGLLAKLPASGDRILEILLEQHREPVALDDDGGPTFWLVVADQFERRGIACARAFSEALTAIDGGADLRDLEARGATARDLKQRSKMLTALAQRLRAPRAARPRPKATKPPAFCVEAGEVFSFPTMRGKGFNPWHRDWEEAGFKPDGWGAMLVVACGRVFDWLPWCAVSSLTIDPTREPTLEDAAKARLVPYSRLDPDHPAALGVPRETHLRKMGMRSLGKLDLDPKKASRVIVEDHTPEYAVACDWSFTVQLWDGTFEGGIAVASLLKSAR